MPVEGRVLWVSESYFAVDVVQDIAPIAPPSWLITTWEFLNDINGKVTFTDPWNLPLDRQGDCHIMPQVLSQLVHIPKPLLSKANLQKFNLCCIYLQVLTLSDIATSSGKEIDSHFWRGHRSSRKSSLKWPHQIWPSSTRWAIWCKTLHLLFTYSARSTRILPAHCLHSWIPNSPYHQIWPTYIDPSTSLLFTKLAGSNSYIIYSPRNRFNYYPTPTNSSPLPTESVLITATRWLPFAAITQYSMRSPTAQVPKAPHPTPPHHTSQISAQVNTRSMQNTPITITKCQFQAPIHSPSQHPIPYAEAPPQFSMDLVFTWADICEV